jgi:hypothetical protein
MSCSQGENAPRTLRLCISRCCWSLLRRSKGIWRDGGRLSSCCSKGVPREDYSTDLFVLMTAEINGTTTVQTSGPVPKVYTNSRAPSQISSLLHAIRPRTFTRITRKSHSTGSLVNLLPNTTQGGKLLLATVFSRALLMLCFVKVTHPVPRSARPF